MKENNKPNFNIMVESMMVESWCKYWDDKYIIYILLILNLILRC